MNKRWNVAIVGATGEVGGQVIECLEERDFPVGTIRFLASTRSAGKIVEFGGRPVAVEEVTLDSFKGIDIAFFSAGRECSREFCPAAVKAGAVCIDSSSAWRMDPEVPLVVPEVNPHAIARYAARGVVAIPSSATIPLVAALKPLHDYAAVRRVVVSTYQAVSGTGSKAIAELQKQSGELLNGRPARCSVYPHQIAFNCLPQIGSFAAGGSTEEEARMVEETRKVLEADVRMTVTAVRVPVFYGTCEAVNVETEKKVTAGQARELLGTAPGVELVDDPAGLLYPLAIDAAGQDLVLVGRIREDDSVEHGLNLWVAADNIRKGAATSAVQIAETLVGMYR